MGRNWAEKIIRNLREHEMKWGLLTNGEQWRIYHQDEPTPYETYLEIELAAILADKAREAYHIFHKFMHAENFIAGSNIRYQALDNLQISLLSKYVGEQYMSNIELDASKLDAYFVNDLQVNYEITTNKLFKSIVLSGLVNNLFNVKYVSNGYFYTYDDTWSDPDQVTTITGAGYYPQAEINFLLGVTLRF